MKRLVYLLILGAALFGGSASAQSPSLREVVEQYVLEQVIAEHPGARESIDIQVSNLDARPGLSPCDGKLHTATQARRPLTGNITVRLACRGSSPWAVYVPVTIQRRTDVAVATRNLPRGTILTEEDIEFINMTAPQAGLGYIEDASLALGMSLKRPLRSGEPVRHSHLANAKVIAKGDKVMLEANHAGISVVTAGTALAAGEIGEQISVKNNSSNRVVDAVIMAPGRARVMF